jgi:hypothetical protein
LLVLVAIAAARHAFGSWRAKCDGRLQTEQNCDEIDAALASETMGAADAPNGTQDGEAASRSGPS